MTSMLFILFEQFSNLQIYLKKIFFLNSIENFPQQWPKSLLPFSSPNLILNLFHSVSVWILLYPKPFDLSSHNLVFISKPFSYKISLLPVCQIPSLTAFFIKLFPFIPPVSSSPSQHRVLPCFSQTLSSLLFASATLLRYWAISPLPLTLKSFNA